MERLLQQDPNHPSSARRWLWKSARSLWSACNPSRCGFRVARVRSLTCRSGTCSCWRAFGPTADPQIADTTPRSYRGRPWRTSPSSQKSCMQLNSQAAAKPNHYTPFSDLESKSMATSELRSPYHCVLKPPCHDGHSITFFLLCLGGCELSLFFFGCLTGPHTSRHGHQVRCHACHTSFHAVPSRTHLLFTRAVGQFWF